MTSAAMLQHPSTTPFNGAVPTMISWGSTPIFDDAGFFDPAFPTRLNVPAGVSRVRVGCTVPFGTDLDDGFVGFAVIAKNGVFSSYPGRACGTAAQRFNAQPARVCLSSGPLLVVPGDFFEINASANNDVSVSVGDFAANFWIEVLG